MSPITLRGPRPVEGPLPPAGPSPEEYALDRIAEALVAFQAPPPPPPPPPIVMPAPDLSRIVTAVNNLKPGPSAAEIAAAIADVLRPAQQDDGAAPLREVAEALRTLDHRMQGFGRQAYGGGAVDLSTASQTYLASEATLEDVKRGVTDFEIRLDYDVRTDANPVYVGKNSQGMSTAATTWTVQKMSYDVDARLTRAEVLVGSWDGRAALPW